MLNIIPQTHLIGFGISFAGMTSRERDAKAVCADWAEAFVEHLNKEHGR